MHDHTGTAVLHSGDLTVAPGRIVAFVGPSGSGKTTLLRAMTGALPAGLTKHAGTVHVLGHDVGDLTGEQLRLLRYERISFVGQDPASRLNPRMRVRRLLTELAADNRAGTARALSRRPALLMLDEPTAGMDTALSKEIGSLLRGLAERDNLAIVFACHDNAIVDAIADDVVRLGHTTTDSVTMPAARLIDRPAVLSVRDLSARAAGTSILTSVSFDLAAGEALAVTGVSGTGKTTLARAIVGLHRSVGGNLTLTGESLSLRGSKRTPAQRRRIQLVPQDPLGTLNPRRTIGETVARPVVRHGLRPQAAVADRVAELLAQVRLPAEFGDRYPHELSGGQRQRVAIARALAAEPDVLLCDEITSALDAGTADTIMSLLAGLRSERGLAMIVISHDLALVATHTDSALTLE